MSNPESYEDLVELLVPELQRRGLMWDDYTVPGGTYRENMFRQLGKTRPAESHASRQFTYENLEKYMDGEGTIRIERQNPDIKAKVEKGDCATISTVEQIFSDKTGSTVTELQLQSRVIQ